MAIVWNSLPGSLHLTALMRDIALIAHADVTYARIMADCDARFLSTEWAGGFVGCLIGVKRR